MLTAFIGKLETDKINVIYGAGYAGRVICKFLRDREMPVAAYVVTASEGERKLDGMPVYALGEILRLYDPMNLCFIIGALSASQSSIKKELNDRGISSYLEVSEELIYALAQENRKRDARQAEAKKEKRKKGKTIGYLPPGYLGSDYVEQRVIAGKIKGVSYIALPKESAVFPRADMFYEGSMETCRELEEACYCPCEYTPEVDFIHTFNAVCDTDLPWSVSFETTVPRVWPRTEEEERYYLRLVELVKKSNCKSLYAICQNAYRIHRQSLIQHIPMEDVELLMKKTKVLHPPQRILILEDEFARKHRVGKFHFIFIGRAFFFKGGREVIHALSKFEGQFEFKLTLVSELAHNDYFTHASYEESLRWRAIIREKSWIEHLEHLRNEDVLEKCREATVGLLPSVADTYGYAVLEMQAAGCPVITTNIRAFPEINNEECGWVCRVPIDDMGCCAERDDAVWSAILQQELERCFQEIFEHPDEIQKKGMAAMERIRKMHDPEAYAKELEKDLF